ncbi:MAG: DUF932 domain-containing protein [Vicinamibacterales bacterium]
MPANVGEMFYTGTVPWHGQGVSLAQPATLDEALKVGGLNWRVDEVDLMTAEDPPSPVDRRKALVRSDVPAGHDKRVLGVAHRGFTPIQNADAGLLFDQVFGNGQRVYHTGGYLGRGEVVWLLAKLSRTVRVGSDDIIEPYALMANSHDGSKAFQIRLTTIRVVCQNTLSLAIRERLGVEFRRSHQGTFSGHATAARDYFQAMMLELDKVGESFVVMSKCQCTADQVDSILKALIPNPTKPRNADRNPGLMRAWETRSEAAAAARRHIAELRLSGKGQDLAGSEGTLWGVLNAVLEYVDHHHKTDQSRISYALFGDGMDLKARAFQVIRQEAEKAA